MLSAFWVNTSFQATSRMDIFRHYLRTWACLRDFLSSLPWDSIAAACGAPHKLQFTLGTLRLLRMGLIFDAFRLAAPACATDVHPHSDRTARCTCARFEQRVK